MVVREARKVSRRRLLGWATGAVTLSGGMAVGLPGDALATPVEALPWESPVLYPGAVRPASRVRDVRPGVAPDAIALTIDDGPNPVWTPPTLELLHRNGIQATFSLIGVHAHTYPDLVKRILAEGHSVCNHSMTHPQPFSRRTPAAIRQQITDAQSAIVEAGGVAPRLFRAPGGDWSAVVLSTVADLRMVPLGWDIDPRDWARPGAALITRRLLAAQPDDIVLCHDGGGNRAETIASLRLVLPVLKSRGLEFVAL